MVTAALKTLTSWINFCFDSSPFLAVLVKETEGKKWGKNAKTHDEQMSACSLRIHVYVSMSSQEYNHAEAVKLTLALVSLSFGSFH